MAMDAGEIERMIKEALPDAVIEIEDLRGDGDHYAARIVSSAFEAQAPINQVDMDGTAKVTLEIESNEEAVVEEVDYGSSAEVAEVGIEIESSE